MENQGQQQEGANVVNIQGSNVHEVHGEVFQVDNIQQAHAEVIHAGNIQHFHAHYDIHAVPPPGGQPPQVQADAGSTGNSQEEMPSTSGSASSLQGTERRNVDLGYSNQDLLVAGSASLLQTEKPMNVEIKESNINIMGGEGMITKGEGATTIIRDSVINIGERSSDGAARKKNEFTDARLASNDIPCPVYEVAPPPLGFLQTVQRAIFGGFLQTVQRAIFKDARKDEKRRLLKEFLSSRPVKKMKSYQKLELFGILYEANDIDLIHSCVKKINLAGESLTTVGMHAISSVMRRRSQLDLVHLKNCCLSAELIHILKSNLKGSSLKINQLDVSLNPKLGPDGFGQVGLVVTQCRVEAFDARSCNLTAEEMEAFKENTLNVKLDRLDVSMNPSLGAAGLKKVGLVVTQCQVKALKIEECNLTAEGMEAFMENTRNTKLNVLDVSTNRKLGTDGFGKVGSVVTQCQVEELVAQNCNLTAEEMKAFKENTRNAKFKKLLIDDNKNLGPDGFGQVGLVVTQCDVKVFDVRNCNLTAEEMEAFKENTRNARLNKLNISKNSNLGANTLGEIGLVVSQCQVNAFEAQRCNLTTEEIKAFKENTRNARMSFLNLSFNPVSKFGDEGLSTISEIVRQCQILTLRMQHCGFNKDQLKRFKALLTGVNFRGD
uniref:uncharacterized protein LOC120341408 n=1 Tax=Styela clava TaxID=7725 RepID=UPI001939D83F|nr:uncharacterized protein LOC120341408 [Styela clava]